MPHAARLTFTYASHRLGRTSGCSSSCLSFLERTAGGLPKDKSCEQVCAVCVSGSVVPVGPGAGACLGICAVAGDAAALAGSHQHSPTAADQGVSGLQHRR